MKYYLYDDSSERMKMVRICEIRLCEAFDNYCSCLGEMHKSWVRAESEKSYNECIYRWQDLNSLKYDPKEQWDLNYDDYNENIDIEYYTK